MRNCDIILMKAIMWWYRRHPPATWGLRVCVAKAPFCYSIWKDSILLRDKMLSKSWHRKQHPSEFPMWRCLFSAKCKNNWTLLFADVRDKRGGNNAWRKFSNTREQSHSLSFFRKGSHWTSLLKTEKQVERVFLLKVEGEREMVPNSCWNQWNCNH